MSDVTIPYRFLVRGGLAAAVTALNEIPRARELVFETDTLKFKLGDGVTTWNSLGYFSTSSVPEGSNLYFTNERAQDALAAAFAAGTHTNVTITYDDASNSFSFAAPAAGMTNPMTTAGDMIVGGTSGTPTRVAAGTATYVWTSSGPGVAPSWQASAGGGGTADIRDIWLMG